MVKEKEYEGIMYDPTGEREEFVKALEEFRKIGKKKKPSIEDLI